MPRLVWGARGPRLLVPDGYGGSPEPQCLFLIPETLSAPPGRGRSRLPPFPPTAALAGPGRTLPPTTKMASWPRPRARSPAVAAGAAAAHLAQDPCTAPSSAPAPGKAPRASLTRDPPVLARCGTVILPGACSPRLSPPRVQVRGEADCNGRAELQARLPPRCGFASSRSPLGGGGGMLPPFHRG